jgi:drug/metabolite transporter (DMT)-like permease
MSSKYHYLPYVSLVTGILAICFSPIFLRWADAPGVVSSFYRMAIGTAVMTIPFITKVSNNNFNLSTKGICLAVMGGIFFALDMFFWSTGVVLGGAAIPTLMANTAPLWVGLGSWLILREKYRNIFWVGLVFALVGGFFILGLDLTQSSDNGQGAWFGLLSALFYGAFFIFSQKSRSYLDTLTNFWISSAVAASSLFVFSRIAGEKLTGYDRRTWILFLTMGLLVQAVGWMLINYAQGHIPAAIVSPTMLAQPLLVIFLAASLLGERFTVWQIIGGTLILLGIFLVHRSQLTRRNRKTRVIA